MYPNPKRQNEEEEDEEEEEEERNDLGSTCARLSRTWAFMCGFDEQIKNLDVEFIIEFCKHDI